MNSHVYTLICFALWFADSRSANEKKSRSGESIAASVLFEGKLTPLWEPKNEKVMCVYAVEQCTSFPSAELMMGRWLQSTLLDLDGSTKFTVFSGGNNNYTKSKSLTEIPCKAIKHKPTLRSRRRSFFCGKSQSNKHMCSNTQRQ